MKSRVYKFYGMNANCRGRGKIETSAAIIDGIAKAGEHVRRAYPRQRRIPQGFERA